jgi:peptide subunit release factor 1 (eRF1)
MTDQVQSIPAILRELRASEPPDGRVLSVILETTARQTIGQAYLLAFRDACKRIRAGLDEAERARFERAVSQAERYLTAMLVPTHPGVALYAAGAEEYFYAVPLPAAPTDLVAWEDAPVIAPLVQALDDYERVAVVLFDKERTRLFTVFLEEIEERRTFQDEVPGKQATGDWFALSQTRYARHHEDHVRRHAKRTIAALMGELRARPFDRLFLAGPDEARALLRRHLPRPLRLRDAGDLRLEFFASDAEVLTAARAAAAELERREELATVRSLFDAAQSPSVAIGLDPVLTALAEGRVHRLVVAAGPPETGGECPDCERLVIDRVPCPLCGGPTAPVPDLRERAIERALEQGAGVERVSGMAAALLEEAGGFGAWTRY